MKPQENPDDGHDASSHRFNPDEKGVCKICGWWNPNGDVCPECGKPWSEHPTALVLVLVPGEAKPESPHQKQAKKAHLS